MNLPDPSQPNNGNPAGRMRNILAAPQGDGAAGDDQSPLARLPHATGGGPVAEGKNPKNAKPARKKKEPAPQGEKQPVDLRRYGPPFWTIASMISLGVNFILLIVLLWALGQVSALRKNPSMAQALKDPNALTAGTLQGLYDSFEAMDAASIQTVIPVDTQVPINLNIQINTQTSVVLSQDVTITGANVRINTGLFNINAPATVTLPAGTTLPINLNLSVPVQDTIPIHIDVPVNIPLAGTGLHDPFIKLQTTILPLYCLVNPAAASTISGVPLCK
jgi:hypothetical protein